MKGRLIIALIGAGMFVFGLLQVNESITMLIDQSQMMFGFVVMLMGALVLSVEMSRW